MIVLNNFFKLITAIIIFFAFNRCFSKKRYRSYEGESIFTPMIRKSVDVVAKVAIGEAKEKLKAKTVQKTSKQRGEFIIGAMDEKIKSGMLPSQEEKEIEKSKQGIKAALLAISKREESLNKARERLEYSDLLKQKKDNLTSEDKEKLEDYKKKYGEKIEEVDDDLVDEFIKTEKALKESEQTLEEVLTKEEESGFISSHKGKLVGVAGTGAGSALTGLASGGIATGLSIGSGLLMEDEDDTYFEDESLSEEGAGEDSDEVVSKEDSEELDEETTGKMRVKKRRKKR